MADETKYAHVEKKTTGETKGCLVQSMGLAAPFVLLVFFGGMGFLIGLVIGLILILTGQPKTGWRCGSCGNPVADKEVRLCPTCGAHLSKRPPWWSS